MKPSALRKFSTSGSAPLSPDDKSTDGRKKSVPGPTSPAHFFNLLIFSLFRRPLSVHPSTKASVYICLSLGGSLIFDFFRPPNIFFSNRHNFVNMLFVKWGWAWTLVCLTIFLIFSAFVYTGGHVPSIRSHLLRLVVGTGCWYVVTGFMAYVLDASGQCHPKTVKLANGRAPLQHRACHRAGGTWIGFDISGHCFLLVMANLWILEELSCMQHWAVLAEVIKAYDRNYDYASPSIMNVPTERLKKARSAFRRLTGSLRVIFSLTACLSMLWDFMFCITIMYFHTMPSKLAGTVLGASCWFLFYKVIFPIAKTSSFGGIAPGMPGDGLIDFVPRR